MIEIIQKYEKQFSCVGQGNEQEGHPKIYLNFGEKKQLECPYCGNKFEFVDEKNEESEEN